MRSEGESHLSLANTSVQKMIKMTPVTPCSSLVTWSVGEVWAAHGFMRCISSINTGSVFLSTRQMAITQYYYHFIILLRFAGVYTTPSSCLPLCSSSFTPSRLCYSLYCNYQVDIISPACLLFSFHQPYVVMCPFYHSSVITFTLSYHSHSSVILHQSPSPSIVSQIYSMETTQHVIAVMFDNRYLLLSSVINLIHVSFLKEQGRE